MASVMTFYQWSPIVYLAFMSAVEDAKKYQGPVVFYVAKANLLTQGTQNPTPYTSTFVPGSDRFIKAIIKDKKDYWEDDLLTCFAFKIKDNKLVFIYSEVRPMSMGSS
jgi:hypothetical protein